MDSLKGAVFCKSQHRLETRARLSWICVIRYGQGKAKQVTVSVLATDVGKRKEGQVGML